MIGPAIQQGLRIREWPCMSMELSEIEGIYRAKLLTRFPYEDIRNIRSSLTDAERKRVEDINPDLDSYLSLIAGFASSATRIANRRTDQLKRALPFLNKSFFETFPDYEFLRDRITEKDAPGLYSQLEAAELLRIELAKLIRTILSRESVE